MKTPTPPNSPPTLEKRFRSSLKLRWSSSTRFPWAWAFWLKVRELDGSKSMRGTFASIFSFFSFFFSDRQKNWNFNTKSAGYVMKGLNRLKIQSVFVSFSRLHVSNESSVSLNGKRSRRKFANTATLLAAAGVPDAAPFGRVLHSACLQSL